MNRFWKFDILKNSYVPSDEPALSAFPTIVNMKNRQVFCRLHKQWENILAFKKNILKSGCGKLYPGPFTTDNTIFNYNFDISKKGKNWFIKVDSQTVSTTKRRLLDWLA